MDGIVRSALDVLAKHLQLLCIIQFVRVKTVRVVRAVTKYAIFLQRRSFSYSLVRPRTTRCWNLQYTTSMRQFASSSSI
jgi:hypothetical protein